MIHSLPRKRKQLQHSSRFITRLEHARELWGLPLRRGLVGSGFPAAYIHTSHASYRSVLVSQGSYSVCHGRSSRLGLDLGLSLERHPVGGGGEGIGSNLSIYSTEDELADSSSQSSSCAYLSSLQPKQADSTHFIGSCLIWSVALLLTTHGQLGCRAYRPNERVLEFSS